ncbi:Na+/H+ antiporter NhaC family protein [Sporosarcina sp. Marseille-Q4063]|uniref:Na+/H+ antiporter NhaC family protein n=1 Tax=Sporosarcina sp. Marseille-Q4063 TaxID=2810514 RepID=UPI001BB0B498|nr:Na+/H+ antiporter NhaC family protein [Sporosarcina sp. Marseille-Q4063]QUW23543.1 Na+/H+ antiporter NhaC family protein [Sporosarcina sp. Marseille-Q4063]
MEATWWSIIPPLLAITCAILTREVILSLLLGVVSGALILANFSLTGGLSDSFQTIFTQVADPEWTTPILIFALMLGGVTALLSKSGATEQFGIWAMSKVKTRVGAQLVTMFTGYAIFIDDYFNSLAVGQIARPITDNHGVSRSKLAYLIDSTGAPICVLIPLSSWGAYTFSLLAEPIKTYGLGHSPVSAFFSVLPANYYAIASLVLVFLIIWFRMDFPLMRKHEQKAVDALRNEQRLKVVATKVPFTQSLDLLLPILAMIIGTILFFLNSGGYFSGGVGLIEASGEGNITLALVYGVVVSVVLAALLYIPRKKLKAKEFLSTFTKGMESMLGGAMILVLAWSIGDIVGRLETGQFLASLVEGNIPMWVIPGILFALGCIMSFATGTSWGTFAIMIPIAATVVGSTNPEWVLPTIGAVMAGAVFGDHCSPISDSTILSAIGAECDLMDHVSTQIPYALTAAFTSLIGYLVFGLTSFVWLGLVVNIIALVGVLLILKRRTEPVLDVFEEDEIVQG